MTDAEILGVSDGATKAEIREAHRRLSLKHHPDRGGDAETFARLTAARDRLLAAAPDRRGCRACKGVGRTTVRSGWSATSVDCEACRGTGVER